VIETLGMMKDPRCLEPLIEALDDLDIRVHIQALESLGKLGDSRAVEPISKMLKDPNPKIRKASIEALREIGDPKAVDALLYALNDEDLEVREEAVRALGRIAEPHVLYPLIRALKEDITIRTEVLMELSHLKDPIILECCIEALKDKNPCLRENAVRELTSFDIPKARDVLYKVALNDEEREVRLEAAWALAEMHDPRALAQIDDPRARKVLIEALEEKDVDPVTSLNLYLRHAVPEYVDVLIEELIEKGDPHIAEAFIKSGNLKLKIAGLIWLRRHR